MSRIMRVVIPCLCFVAFPILGSAQPAVQSEGGVVAGTVVDERGVPIENVRVTVRGTNREVVSDASGRFRLTNVRGTEVPIQAARIGFQRWTGTAAVGGADVRVVLRTVAVNLDEVVVTGTAAPVERRAVGNAVDKIAVADIVRTAPVNSISDLLKGRSSSVVVTGVAGVVGAGPQLAIRGRSSLSLTSEPLIYIDGVRANNSVATGPSINASEPNISRLGDLSPEQIESIEVIKGAAAATLYGTEASNGVIQIITKQGRAGARPVVETALRAGANWFMNPEGRIDNNFTRDAVTGDITELNLLAQERAAGTPLFRTGGVQGLDLSVNGGSVSAAGAGVRYYAASGYDREEGIEPTNAFRRFNGRANIALTPNDKFELNVNIGVINARRDMSLDRGLSLLFALQFANPALRNGPTRGFNTAPPEFWWNAFDTFQNLDRYVAGVRLNHRPFSWLQHRLTVGQDQDTEDNQVLSEVQPASIRQFLSATDRDGRKIVNRRNETVHTADYGATATAKLTDKISSNTSVGAQYYRRYSRTQYAEGRGFPAPGVATVTAAAQTFGGDDYLENVTVGSYVQEMVSFGERVFLTAAVRADDNSAFGGDFDIVTYPKASATWVVSEESFWPLKSVETLKLRTAYGQSGLQPSAFAAIRTYRPTTGSQGSAVSPLAVGNPSLGPERAEELEVGFEAGLLRGRVGIDFTYYTKRTKDMILTRTPPPSSGFTGAQFFNAGEVKSSGTELLVTLSPVNRAKLKWDVNFNVATNSNRIVDLDPANAALTCIGGTVRHCEGDPVGVFYERRVVSATYNPTTRQAENLLCDGGPTATAPVACATAPAVYRDQPIPKWEGGFSNSLRLFDRVTLWTHLDFRGGHYLRDETNWGRCSVFRVCELNVRPELYDPIDVAYAQLGLRGRYLSSADFLKLREISVTFDVPDRWARRAGVGRASIAVAGRNLHTWTNYTGLDPENAASTSIQSFNYYEQTTTPQLASFLSTIRVTW